MEAFRRLPGVLFYVYCIPSRLLPPFSPCLHPFCFILPSYININNRAISNIRYIGIPYIISVAECHAILIHHVVAGVHSLFFALPTGDRQKRLLDLYEEIYFFIFNPPKVEPRNGILYSFR
jgi:hypothetical protein